MRHLSTNMNEPQPHASPPATFVAHLLRSVTPVTGCLIAGLGVCLPILTAAIAELKVGSPSSTAGLAIPFAVIWGAVAATVGAIAGHAVRERVQRSRWAGPVDRDLVALVLLFVVGAGCAIAMAAVLRHEAGRRPRVQQSTGEIVRSQAPPDLKVIREGTFIWVAYPKAEHPVHELRWNGQPVNFAINDRELVVRAGSLVTAAVDLTGSDYPREAYGVTARMSGDSSEWLALLVHLRITGERDLLVIFEPSGRLVHEELLERRRGRGLSPVGIGIIEPTAGLQEILVNSGTPFRYRMR